MKEIYFVREEDVLTREAWLTELAEDRIAFKLKATHPENGGTSTIEGEAIGKMGGIELREDDSSEAYPVREYYFEEGQYRLCIAVDIREKDIIWIMESGSEGRHQPGVRFGGDGPLMPEIAG